MHGRCGRLPIVKDGLLHTEYPISYVMLKHHFTLKGQLVLPKSVGFGDTVASKGTLLAQRGHWPMVHALLYKRSSFLMHEEQEND